MEKFEILNDMLTMTVSTLFGSYERTIDGARNFRYVSETNQEYSTIPRTPKKTREPVDQGTAVKMRRWVDNSGTEFLNKAMDRLQITLDDIKHLKYRQYTFDYLLKEKKRVKEEL